MKRFLAAVALAIGLGVCATAPVMAAEKVKTFVAIEKPAPGATLILVTPEISLGLLTAGGVTEPKADWSKAAEGYLSSSITSTLKAKAYTVAQVHVDTFEDPRAVQMLKLNDEVLGAIAWQAIPMLQLPTKTTFDWTLGSGAQVLVPASAAEQAPRYALFLRGRGSYQSSAKAALNVGMALLGGPMQFGGQSIQATLVDLNTGQIVWYELDTIPPGEDIREAEGAASAVARLFKNLPL